MRAAPHVSIVPAARAGSAVWPLVAAIVLGGVLLALPVPAGLPVAGHRTAALFAVAKGDMRRVRDFYNGAAIDAIVNLNVTG